MSFVKNTGRVNHSSRRNELNKNDYSNNQHLINPKNKNNGLKGDYQNALVFTGVSTANNLTTPLVLEDRESDFIEIIAEVSDYENSFLSIGLQFKEETPYFFRTENFFQQSASSTVGVIRIVLRKTHAPKFVCKFLNSAGSNLNGNVSVYWK